MYPPPPPPGPVRRPGHQDRTVPLFVAVLIGVGALLFGCVGGAAIMAAPAPSPTPERTSAAADSSSSAPSPSASPSPSESPTSPDPTPTRVETSPPTAGDVPDPDRTTAPARRHTRPAEPEPEPEPEPTKRAVPDTDPRFSSCAKANDAGYGPYRRSDTEYSWYQDRDRDGVVCER